jgi:hypothetical protein
MTVKQIRNLFNGFVMSVTLLCSNPSFSQSLSKTVSTQCDIYPTTDGGFNSTVQDLLVQIDRFESRMALLYQKLSPAQQEQANSLLTRRDEGFLTIFPEFNDEELKTSVTQIREKYVAVLKKHEDIFPNFDRRQRDETVKTIIQCAGSKARAERESLQSGKVAIDRCETDRRNCIISVGAQAAGMHLACSIADLTIIAGIVCHAAAFVYQVTAGNNCNIAADRCRRSGN